MRDLRDAAVDLDRQSRVAAISIRSKRPRRSTAGRGCTSRIADVDHFVAPGSAIDRFAGNNTTSVYTGVRTFPMLPERLSFDLSSLLPGEARPAMVIETWSRDDGSIGDARASIRRWSRTTAKLDYPSVSAWLDGHGPPPAPLAHDATLRAQVELHDRLARTLGRGAAARRRARRRHRRGAPDRRRARHGHRARTRIIRIARGASIEELMIASNRAVAHALDEAGLASIRRVVKRAGALGAHRRLRRRARAQAAADAELAARCPASSTRCARTHADEFSRDLARDRQADGARRVRGARARRSPRSATSGSPPTSTRTRPRPTGAIPDLVTQRLLKALAQRRQPPYRPRASWRQIAEHCTRWRRQAQKVERRVQKSAAAALLEPRVGDVFDGVITGAERQGRSSCACSTPPVEGKVVRGGRGLEVGAEGAGAARSTSPSSKRLHRLRADRDALKPIQF